MELNTLEDAYVNIGHEEGSKTYRSLFYIILKEKFLIEKEEKHL